MIIHSAALHDQPLKRKKLINLQSKEDVPMSSFDDLIQKAINGEPPKSKVLGIGGRPRKGGNSDILLKHMLKGVNESKSTADSLHLRDYKSLSAKRKKLRPLKSTLNFK